MKARFVRALLVLQLTASQCLSIGARAQGGLSGRVVDSVTREPVELAVVTDIGTGKSEMTDKAGIFKFRQSSFPAQFQVSAIGFVKRQVTISSPGQESPVIPLQHGALDLKEVTITHYSSSSAGSPATLGQIDLNLRPTRSAQDLLRLVPGLFIAQHQGGGKAEQIFLRGFDADHGTDVYISVDDIPLNMVSHAHGQGYADMHFVIPETIAGYEYGKGPYYPERGDFCTAGYVALNTKKTLGQNMIKLEGGEFHNGRIMGMLNLLSPMARDSGRSAYIAAEGLYFDGPFDYPEHFNRGNLFGKFITPIGKTNTLTAILSTFSSGWRASGEVPNRAVGEGYIKDRFGALDSAQGGNTTRTNATFRLETRMNDHLSLDNQIYYTHYYFNLITNFTFYYYYPEQGDEFRQHERRDLYGYHGKFAHHGWIGNAALASSAGWGLRADRISNSFLAHTLEGDSILNYLQLGSIREIATNAYLEETLVKGPWLFNAGVRMDYLYFHYDNRAPRSDSSAALFDGAVPGKSKHIVSPKLNIQYTATSRMQFYVKLGKGFHSNDARIVIASQGQSILPAAYGIDFGVNWKPAPRILVNAALWYLYLRQEFTYGQDLGDQSVSPSGRTQRKGIDLSARWQLLDWLYGNLNVDLARPRFLDSPKGADYLPLAPTFTSTAALDFRFPDGWNGGISYRYLRNRPANTTNTLTALGYFVTDLTVNYTKKKYEVGLALENLLNQQWNESQFEYISRLKYEKAPVDQVSFTPGTPFFAKLNCTIFF